MKKVLLVLTLTLGTLVSKSQDTTGYASKIVNKFKNEYVSMHFKDPYSFQLLNITYTPVTKEKSLKTLIWADSIQLEAFNKYKLLLRKEIKVLVNNIETNTRILTSLSEIDKQKLEKYSVLIECRGTNSYGGNVFNRYICEYYVDNDLLKVLQ
jgi:CRISPR/Cas system-associated endonuclease Cas3-HD